MVERNQLLEQTVEIAGKGNQRQKKTGRNSIRISDRIEERDKKDRANDTR